MKNKMFTLVVVGFAATVLGAAADDDDRDSRGGGLPALSRRVAALEAVVARQSTQIDSLRRALEREMTARRAADASIQLQITNLQQSSFTPVQVETLQGFAGVVSVVQSNIYLAGNLCVGGDVAINQGRSLFVSHVQPSDGACGGNPAGITVFAGNVGIQATNSLFVNNLRAFQAISPTPQELLDFGVSMPPLTITGGPATTVILYGPVLLRSGE